MFVILFLVIICNIINPHQKLPIYYDSFYKYCEFLIFTLFLLYIKLYFVQLINSTWPCVIEKYSLKIEKLVTFYNSIKIVR